MEELKKCFRGAEKLKYLIEKAKLEKRPILVYFDPDVDGLFSGYFVCKLLDILGIKYTYYVNSKRKHGFDLPLNMLIGYLIIAVDFGIPEGLFRNLVYNNIDIISLDHHNVVGSTLLECEFKDAYGIIVNNHYTFEDPTDRYLSGAGVVYEVICYNYPDFKSIENEAIVGITLLSDAREIENKKARRYLTKTYSADTQSGYLGYLLKSTLLTDFGFGIPKLDRNYIDYTFSPTLNALLRFGKEAEALNFIMGNGLSSSCTKIRELQAELIADMVARCNRLDLPNLLVLGCKVEDFSDWSDIDLTCFIGYFASREKGTGKSTIAFVLDGDRVIRASFRGRYDDIPYDENFKVMGIDAQGHPGAFGIVNFNPEKDIWFKLNDLIESLDKGHSSKAKIIDASNLSFIMLQRGMEIATENCYVRDMYRTYINYVGKGCKVAKTTYNDVTGAVKYMEYFIDGKTVKAFDDRVTPENGLILPILTKGHITLFVKERIL